MLSRYKFPDEYVLYMFLQHWVRWSMKREFRAPAGFTVTIPAGATNPHSGFSEDDGCSESVHHLPGMGVPHSYHET